MTTNDKSSKELLTFQLGDQEYAVDIMSVREIRGWTKTTPMPHAPTFMKGVINLRGTVLPVIDLSTRLGLDPIETTDRNVIIVVKTSFGTTGLLVNAVSDIITLSIDDLQPPPDISTSSEAGSITALTLIEEKLVRILDLEAITSNSESAAA